MNAELLYTSASQGLKQGSRGFCTVLSTSGLPINLAQRLEHSAAIVISINPATHALRRTPFATRIRDFQLEAKPYRSCRELQPMASDYSQRTNKIAHHVLSICPCQLAGPAVVLGDSNVMRSEWDGACKTLANGPHDCTDHDSPKQMRKLERIAGDAGWGGVVANAWLQPAPKPLWIIFNEDQASRLLELIQEATAILPDKQRWQATFSTYFTNLPPDVQCRVRCVIAGSDEARMSIARGTVIDLTKPLPAIPPSPAVTAARNGELIGGTIKTAASLREDTTLEDEHFFEQVETSLEESLQHEASASLKQDDSEFLLQPPSKSSPNRPPSIPSQRVFPQSKVNNDFEEHSRSSKQLLPIVAIGFAIVTIIGLIIGIVVIGKRPGEKLGSKPQMADAYAETSKPSTPPESNTGSEKETNKEQNSRGSKSPENTVALKTPNDGRQQTKKTSEAKTTDARNKDEDTEPDDRPISESSGDVADSQNRSKPSMPINSATDSAFPKQIRVLSLDASAKEDTLSRPVVEIIEKTPIARVEVAGANYSKDDVVKVSSQPSENIVFSLEDNKLYLSPRNCIVILSQQAKETFILKMHLNTQEDVTREIPVPVDVIPYRDITVSTNIDPKEKSVRSFGEEIVGVVSLNAMPLETLASNATWRWEMCEKNDGKEWVKVEGENKDRFTPNPKSHSGMIRCVLSLDTDIAFSDPIKLPPIAICKLPLRYFIDPSKKSKGKQIFLDIVADLPSELSHYQLQVGKVNRINPDSNKGTVKYKEAKSIESLLQEFEKLDVWSKESNVQIEELCKSLEVFEKQFTVIAGHLKGEVPFIKSIFITLDESDKLAKVLNFFEWKKQVDDIVRSRKLIDSLSERDKDLDEKDWKEDHRVALKNWNSIAPDRRIISDLLASKEIVKLWHEIDQSYIQIVEHVSREPVFNEHIWHPLVLFKKNKIQDSVPMPVKVVIDKKGLEQFEK